MKTQTEHGALFLVLLRRNKMKSIWVTVKRLALVSVTLASLYFLGMIFLEVGSFFFENPPENYLRGLGITVAFAISLFAVPTLIVSLLVGIAKSERLDMSLVVKVVVFLTLASATVTVFLSL